jgi:hypothetical protein
LLEHLLHPQEVFGGEPLRAVEQLRRTDVIPPALKSDYQKLLGSQVGRRLNPAKVCAQIWDRVF